MKPKHPMQPIIWKNNIIRFKENKLVRMLLEHSSKTGLDLNTLTEKTYYKPSYKEDWNQFAQLIGYSVSGFSELNYANKNIIYEADKRAQIMIKARQIKRKLKKSNSVT